MKFLYLIGGSFLLPATLFAQACTCEGGNVVVSGSIYPSENGTYARSDFTDGQCMKNGKAVFRKGGTYIYYLSGRWVLRGVNATSDSFYQSASTTSDTPPESGYGPGGCCGGPPAEALTLTTTCPAGSLPVELTSFRLSLERESVKASWETSRERDASHFDLLKSKNGTVFETAATIPASGNTAQPRRYEWEDRTPYPGVSYYQLRQVDQDGSVHTLRVRAVVNDSGIRVYPNPVTDRLVTVLPAGLRGRAILLSSTGYPVAAFALSGTETEVRMPSVSPGVFTLIIFDEANRILRTEKLVK